MDPCPHCGEEHPFLHRAGCPTLESFTDHMAWTVTNRLRWILRGEDRVLQQLHASGFEEKWVDVPLETI